LNREEIRSTLTKLLRLYSPSGREEKAVSFLHSILSSLNIKSQIDEVGNLIAYKDGLPKVMLAGHIDTVRGKLPIRVDDGIVWGRGAVDAKGPLISLLNAFQRYEGKLGLVFAALVDEEAESRGAKFLSMKKPLAKYAIFGEPTGLRAAAVAHRGSITFRLEIECGGGHSSTSWAYNNPILLLMKIVEDLSSSFPTYKDNFKNVTVTLTGIHAKRSQGVPKRCIGYINLRYPPQYSAKEISSTLENILSTLPRECKFSLFQLTSFQPYRSKIKGELISAFRLGFLKITGSRPLFIRKLGTGDMSVIAPSWNIEALTYGPGDPKLSHTTREHISIDDIITASDIILATLNELEKVIC